MPLIVRLEETVTGFPIGSQNQYHNLIERRNEIKDVLEELPDVGTLVNVFTSDLVPNLRLRMLDNC